ncbi:hypothetical protein ACKKBG_A19295 [Auxenochlorella protothecoides x Auxenochlorella symbiontica]
MSKGLDLTSWSAGFHSQRALLKDGEEKAQEHVGKGGDPQTNKGHKMYEQDKTAGGAYGDRDDPSAQGVQGVQPTEGRDTSDIVQEDTAAINVTPAESGNAEGGSPMDKSKDSSESVLGVQPSGGG